MGKRDASLERAVVTKGHGGLGFESWMYLLQFIFVLDIF